MRTATETATTPFSIISIRVTLTGGELTKVETVELQRRQRPHRGDQRPRRADPARGGAEGGQREDRRRQRERRTRASSYKQSLQAAIDPGPVAEASVTGLCRVEDVMGIPVGIDVRDPVDRPRRARSAPSRGCDGSTRRSAPTAPTARSAAWTPGRWRSRDAAPEVRDVLERCEGLRARTRGCFDVRARGALDPSGFVKGWAVEAAADDARARPARGTCACTPAATCACAASGLRDGRGASGSSIPGSATAWRPC